MKAGTMWLSAVVASVMAASAFAQSETTERPYFPDIVAIQNANFEELEKKYASCLSSENAGVVESALSHIGMLKLRYPARKLNVLAPAVDSVAARHSVAEIRYKAYLVATLLNNPRRFAQETRRDYSSPDEFFGALAARIHADIVGKAAR
ncbi:MAG TPA: hypothetical protein VNL69_08265 [Bacteroidota bacterium]|nr:hypothetical protein [Bacteroidota bacterium]